MARKKPTLWLIPAAILICVILAVCILANTKSPFRQTGTGSELEGVTGQILASDFASLSPYLEVQWKNRGDAELSFTGEFYLYRLIGQTWAPCEANVNTTYSLPYGLEAGGALQHHYDLRGRDLLQPGKYRLEVAVTRELSQSDWQQGSRPDRNTYSAWVEFTLPEGAPVYTWKAAEIIYDSGAVSTPEAYRYIAGTLQALRTGKPPQLLGRLSDSTLDQLVFIDAGPWQALANTLHINTRQVYETFESGERMHLLLEQADGTLYYLYGQYSYSRNSDGSEVSTCFSADLVYRLEACRAIPDTFPTTSVSETVHVKDAADAWFYSNINCLNTNHTNGTWGGFYHFPLFKCESRQALLDFLRDYSAALGDENPGQEALLDVGTHYDDGFFEENALMAVFIYSAPEAFGTDISYSILVDKETLVVNLYGFRWPAGTTDGLLVFFSADKAAIRDCTNFDAVLTLIP